MTEHDNEPDPEVIWTAYFDESGTHDESPIVLMGGFLARAENWKGFEADYSQLLKCSGVSYVHGTALLHGKGQFRGGGRRRLTPLFFQYRA